MIYLTYVFCTTIAVIAVFAACCWIYDHFKAKWIETEAVYKVGLVKTASEEIQWLSEETIRKVNDSLHDMFESMNGES